MVLVGCGESTPAANSLALGEACTANTQCASNFCSSLVCSNFTIDFEATLINHPLTDILDNNGTLTFGAQGDITVQLAVAQKIIAQSVAVDIYDYETLAEQPLDVSQCGDNASAHCTMEDFGVQTTNGQCCSILFDDIDLTSTTASESLVVVVIDSRGTYSRTAVGAVSAVGDLKDDDPPVTSLELAPVWAISDDLVGALATIGGGTFTKASVFDNGYMLIGVANEDDTAAVGATLNDVGGFTKIYINETVDGTATQTVSHGFAAFLKDEVGAGIVSLQGTGPTGTWASSIGGTAPGLGLTRIYSACAAAGMNCPTN